jgi:hypothetical protein
VIPSLLSASDVLGTGWFGAVAAEAGPGKTVAVVGDGAIGLLTALDARQPGAERIIATSRHESACFPERRGRISCSSGDSRAPAFGNDAWRPAPACGRSMGAGLHAIASPTVG